MTIAPLFSSSAPVYSGEGVEGTTPLAMPPSAAGPQPVTPTGRKISVISPNDGKAYELDEAYLDQAKAQGYQIESPEAGIMREYVARQGLTGKAAVFLNRFINEASFGAQDALVKGAVDRGLIDPYQAAKWGALQAEHDTIGKVGSGLGFLASMAYGGELAAGAGKAAKGFFLGGGVAPKALARSISAEAAYRIGEEGAVEVAKHAPSLARSILEHSAEWAGQGLAFASPKAAVEMMTGDPERAAETWLWGAVGGAALGGAFGLTKGAAGKLFSGAGGAVAEAAAQEAPGLKEKAAAKLREVGDEQAISSLDMTQKFSGKLRKIKGGTQEATKIIQDANLAQHAGDAPAMAEAVGGLRDEVGGKIGDIYRAHSDVVMGVKDLERTLKAPIARAGKEMGSQGAAETAAGWVEKEFLAPLNEHKPGGLTLSDLHDVRVALDKATRWDSTVPNAVNELRKDIRSAVTEAIEKKLETASKSVGRELVPELRALNKQYSVLRVMSDAAEHNVIRGMANRRHSITDYAGNAIGSTVGGFIGGGVGSVVGGIVGGEANNFLRRKAPGLLSRAAYGAADALEGRGMVALEQAFAAHDKQLSVIPTVLDRMASGGQSKPVRDTLGVNILTRFIEAHDAKLDDHKGVMGFADNLASLAANPDRMEQKINEAIAPLQSEAPEVAMAVGTKLGQVVGYLAQQAPKSPYAVPVPFTPQREWRPSEQQIKDYKTKIAVAKDPYVAIDALGDGTLTKAHVDALRALAPRLHEEMVRRITDYGASGRAPALPYAQRLKLSMMTGAPLDRSIAQLASLQATYQPSEQSGGGSKKMNLPAAQASDLSRITG